MRTASNQVFTDFIETPKEYILINPTDESIEFMYGGETRIVPAYNKVTLPHPKFADVPHSAVDETGAFIPGTLLLKDIFGPVSEALGGAERIWNAAEAIKHALGIDVKTGAASGGYALRGLTVGPRVYTKAVIDKLKAVGRERYQVWRLKEAEDTVAAFDSKNKARALVGMAQLPPDDATRKAGLLLSMSAKRDEKAYNESMDVTFTEEATQKQGPATSPMDGVELLSDEDKKKLFEALVKDKVVQSHPDFVVRELNKGKKKPAEATA